MLRRIFLCSTLILLTIAKFYSIDENLDIRETIDFSFKQSSVATSKFIDDRNKSGWTYLEIQTNGAYPDWLQTYTAGYLEGYAAYNLIWAAWNNARVDYLQRGLEQVPKNVTTYIQNQTKWALEMAKQNPNDPYWNLVNSTLAQLFGIYDGYIIAALKAGRKDLIVSFDDFYTITYTIDIADVIQKFVSIDVHQPRCSFLLKLAQEGLYASHTTWGDYSFLIRTYKVFEFNLNNPLVQAKKISFSSQPGSVPSLDDFYIIDGNRAVTETTLESFNYDVYNYLHYDSLPYWIRVTVANLAFTDQKSWAELYFKYRSGTANDQWLIIDFNNYRASKDNLSEARDIIWMVEEFYSLTSAQDVTQELLIPQGYVASYNVPYNATIQNLSQAPTNYTSDPRYTLFKKYAPGIKNFEDFRNVMRLNNISDTQNYCQAIASRCDLNPTQTLPWGAFDCKITSDSWANSHQAWIISGPTTSDKHLPPFTWKDWPKFENQIAEMPETFDFDWVFLNPDQNFSKVHIEIL